MNPFEAYHKSNIGTVVSPLALGVLGYLGTKKLGRKIPLLLSKGQSPEIKRKAMEYYSNIGENRLARLVGAGLGGAELLRKSTEHSDALQDTLASLIPSKKGGRGFDFNLEPPELPKMAMDKNAYSDIIERANYDKDIISPYKMMGHINNDQFLDAWDKLKADSYIADSDPEKRGITSGKKITQTALRAGVGFAPSYFFGKTLAGLAGMPDNTLKRMGTLGGIAGAVYNTGIFGDKKG